MLQKLKIEINKELQELTASTNATDNGPAVIKKVNEGITSAEALERYKDELTQFESAEISNFEKVYTIGDKRI